MRIDLRRHDTPEIVKKVCKMAFPDYKGYTCNIVGGVKSVNCRSYWDGGSRDYYVFVRLLDYKTVEAPDSHPFFNKDVKGVESVEIPEGCVCIRHTYFCGKDHGLTIMTPAENLLPMPKVELNDKEIAVLKAHSGLKSSYAQISDYRKYALTRKDGREFGFGAGMTGQEVDEIREELKKKGMLNKRGAITIEGSNQLSLRRR